MRGEASGSQGEGGPETSLRNGAQGSDREIIFDIRPKDECEA